MLANNTARGIAPGQEKVSLGDYKQSKLVEFAEFDAVMTTQFTPNDTYYATAYASAKYGSVAQWAPQAIRVGRPAVRHLVMLDVKACSDSASRPPSHSAMARCP